MSELDVNKAFAAVLVAGIAFVGFGLLGNGLVHPKEYEHLAIAIPQQGTVAVLATAAAPEVPFPVLLASADAGRGEGTFKQQGCVACHSVNDGGKNGVGPNLYGIVDRAKAEHEGYAYSAALKGKGGEWSYADLNTWLLKPATYVPGTKMSYAGLADASKRADVIVYLRSLAATPVALPAVPAKAASAEMPSDVKPASTAVATAPASAAVATAPSATAGAAAPVPQAGTPTPIDGITPIAARMASADVDAGKALTMRQGCVACHSFNEGGKNGVGPNLYGVVGQPVAAHAAGYAYSSALKGHTGEQWSYEELDKWLLKPAVFAPGTKMAYAGLANEQSRANIIAYLRSLAATPEPLPTP